MHARWIFFCLWATSTLNPNFLLFPKSLTTNPLRPNRMNYDQTNAKFQSAMKSCHRTKFCEPIGDFEISSSPGLECEKFNPDPDRTNRKVYDRTVRVTAKLMRNSNPPWKVGLEQDFYEPTGNFEIFSFPGLVTNVKNSIPDRTIRVMTKVMQNSNPPWKVSLEQDFREPPGNFETFSSYVVQKKHKKKKKMNHFRNGRKKVSHNFSKKTSKIHPKHIENSHFLTRKKKWMFFFVLGP